MRNLLAAAVLFVAVIQLSAKDLSLKSKDMVNWEYLARIYDRLDAPRYDAFEGYGNGYWKGIRPALFSYNVLKDAGIACFDDFTMKFN